MRDHLEYMPHIPLAISLTTSWTGDLGYWDGGMGMGDGIELEMSNKLIPVFSMRQDAAGMQSKEGRGRGVSSRRAC